MTLKPIFRPFFCLILAGFLVASLHTPAASTPVLATPDPDPHFLNTGPALADLDLGNYSGFTLGDVDGDGDTDALAGDITGRMLLFRNGGGPQVGSNFYRELDNLYPGGIRPNQLDYSNTDPTYVHPELVDNDRDGDQDLFVAAMRRVSGEPLALVVDYYRNDANTYFTKNTGLDKSVPSITRIPEYACRNANDLPGFSDLPWYKDSITLAVGDLNSDGEQDAVVGVIFTPNYPDEGLKQYQLRIYMGVNNPVTGDNDCPVLMTNYDLLPASLRLPGGRAFPELHDVDSDGDLDLFVGLSSGVVRFFKNTGTRYAPAFNLVTGAQHPLNPPGTTDPQAEPDFGAYVVPEFGLLDTDFITDFAALSGDGQVFAMRYDRGGEDRLMPWLTSADFLMPLDTGGRIVNVDKGGGAVTFADLDGDGDLDALTGHKDGEIRNYKNLLIETGQRRYVQLNGAARWFPADYGMFPYAVPVLGDFDGQVDPLTLRTDADLVIAALVGSCPELDMGMTALSAEPFRPPSDLEAPPDFSLLGGTDGGNSWGLCYYENEGNATLPNFQLNASPLAGERYDPFESVIISDEYLFPTMVNADDNAWPDLVIGTKAGGLIFMRNLGDEAGPVFEVWPSSGPGLPTDMIPYGAPSFVDVDGDTSPDLAIGTMDGLVRYYRNNQEPDDPGQGINNWIGPFTEVTGVQNPFAFLDAGSYAAPVFADLDLDNDADLALGSALNTFRFYQNITPATPPGRPLALVDYRYNPLAVVVPPNYAATYYRSVNMLDFDLDGDLDAFVGGDTARGSDAFYYLNIGTPNIPVYRLQPNNLNPMGDVYSPQTLINVSFADTHPDKPGVEAYVGGRNLSGNGYLRAYEYDTGAEKYVLMNPQPFYYPSGLPGTFNTNYEVGPRAAFVDIDGDADLDMFTILGYWVNKPFSVLLFTNEADEEGARFTVPANVQDFEANAFIPGNPFWRLNWNQALNNGYWNGGMVDRWTWWFGNEAGQVQTFLEAFYDAAENADYIGRVTDRRDPFKGVKLPASTVPTAADTNGDGFPEAYIASANGMIQYFVGSATPPPSPALVFLPLIRR